jgi:cold shock CspA family protein
MPTSSYIEGMVYTGETKSFNGAKGYGFVRCSGHLDIFVHASAIARELREPGCIVEFSAVYGEKGWRAESVVGSRMGLAA